MEINQFLQQLALGLNQLEVKGQNNVTLLAYLISLVGEYNKSLLEKQQNNNDKDKNTGNHAILA